MGLAFDSPRCSGRLEVNDADAGKIDKCPLCGEEIEIPSATQPKDIGGWLLIPGLGLVGSPILIGLRIFFALNRGSDLGVPLLMDIVMIVGCIIVAVLFHSRRRIAVPAVIGLLAANIVYGVVLGGLWHDVTVAVPGFVLGAIWIPYFCYSKRVRYTFIR